MLRAKVHAKMPTHVHRKIFRLMRRLSTQHRPIRRRSIDEHRRAVLVPQLALDRMVAINAARDASGSRDNAKRRAARGPEREGRRRCSLHRVPFCRHWHGRQRMDRFGRSIRSFEIATHLVARRSYRRLRPPCRHSLPPMHPSLSVCRLRSTRKRSRASSPATLRRGYGRR